MILKFSGIKWATFLMTLNIDAVSKDIINLKLPVIIFFAKSSDLYSHFWRFVSHIIHNLYCVTLFPILGHQATFQGRHSKGVAWRLLIPLQLWLLPLQLEPQLWLLLLTSLRLLLPPALVEQVGIQPHGLSPNHLHLMISIANIYLHHPVRLQRSTISEAIRFDPIQWLCSIFSVRSSLYFMLFYQSCKNSQF